MLLQPSQYQRLAQIGNKLKHYKFWILPWLEHRPVTTIRNTHLSQPQALLDSLKRNQIAFLENKMADKESFKQTKGAEMNVVYAWRKN